VTAPSRRLRYKGTARLNRLEWQGALVDERNALRMERDAAHEECARLTAERDGWRALSDERTADLDGALRDCNSAWFRWGQAVAVAHRLVQVICKDAERIATLTAERDRARDIAVALEQGLIVTRVPMDSDRAPEVDA